MLKRSGRRKQLWRLATHCSGVDPENRVVYERQKGNTGLGILELSLGFKVVFSQQNKNETVGPKIQDLKSHKES